MRWCGRGFGGITSAGCALAFFLLLAPRAQALSMLPNPLTYDESGAPHHAFVETTLSLVEAILGTAPAGGVVLGQAASGRRTPSSCWS